MTVMERVVVMGGVDGATAMMEQELLLFAFIVLQQLCTVCRCIALQNIYFSYFTLFVLHIIYYYTTTRTNL